MTENLQIKHLGAFIERYTKRTKTSKHLAQTYRPVLADNKTLVGFNLYLKELFYPIVGKRSAGSRIWDVDGNEYIDVTMGFGVNLFGHNPPFIKEALQEQLELGVQLGPQAELASEVAQLISQLTGMEQVAFSNTGTEAVMAVLLRGGGGFLSTAHTDADLDAMILAVKDSVRELREGRFLPPRSSSIVPNEEALLSARK